MLLENAPAGRAYDVFNGDADGICALHQLRLAEPKQAILVTGVKRDIQLLQRVPAAPGDQILVLDISLDANIAALQQHLAAGASVRYFDHHTAALAFEHAALDLHWDDAPEVCTSILVNRFLHGKFAPWACVAAYGDNLTASADALCLQAGMSPIQASALRELGTLLNYNAYGEKLEDLHVPPAVLYQDLHAYADPFDFIASASYFQLLQQAYAEDLARLAGLTAANQQNNGAIYLLPNQAWARRISGLLANQLTRQTKQQSFAVLTEKENGSFVVSIRSADPEHKPASAFCARFASGGGRRAAGGINALPAADLALFTQRFFAYF